VANRRIEEQLEALGRLRGVPAAEAAPALRKALADRVNLVAAKAANLAADLNVPDVLPDLLRAFDRLFEDPVKRDPQCWGKNAMARALKDLGHRESSAFLRGAVHIQMEPVWGGQEDTAGPLRGICLLGLPACADLAREQVLRHMVNALTEPSPTVRADAARALAEMHGDDCALLLRLKARSGDAEPAVTGQVLESLIALERRDALPFVRQFLAAGDQVAEEAALALGGSRQSEAVEVLLETWPTARGLEYRQALLRALSISRQDRAIEFLNHLAAEGRPQDAADARAALELFPTAAPPPLETE
jgi:HEAT repeat protein